MVQKGLLNKEKFYIPQDKVIDYDGSVVRFSITENEMKSQYTDIRLYEMDTTEGLAEDTSKNDRNTNRWYNNNSINGGKTRCFNNNPWVQGNSN